MAISYNTTLTNTSDLTTYSMGNVTATQSCLLVVAVIGRVVGGATVSSVSIGGSAASLVVATTSAEIPMAMYAREVSSGSQAISVTFSTGSLRCIAIAWEVTDYNSATASDTDLNFTAGGSSGSTSRNITLDFPTNGMAIYANAHSSGENTVFGAATENIDTFVESALQIAGANKTASGAGNTETISWATTANASSVGAVWEPAAAGGQPTYKRFGGIVFAARGSEGVW